MYMSRQVMVGLFLFSLFIDISYCLKCYDYNGVTQSEVECPDSCFVRFPNNNPVGGIRGKINGAIGDTKNRIGNAADKTKEGVKGAAEKAKEGVKGAADKAKEEAAKQTDFVTKVIPLVTKTERPPLEYIPQTLDNRRKRNVGTSGGCNNNDCNQEYPGYTCRVCNTDLCNVSKAADIKIGFGAFMLSVIWSCLFRYL